MSPNLISIVVFRHHWRVQGGALAAARDYPTLVVRIEPHLDVVGVAAVITPDKFQISRG